eukprot:scaffold56142_cov39-Attheya_sp.AAC.1
MMRMHRQGTHQTHHYWIVLLVSSICWCCCLREVSAFSAHRLSYGGRRTANSPAAASASRLYSSSITDSASASPKLTTTVMDNTDTISDYHHYSQSELESMTVKALRGLIKERFPTERTSHLRLKQDLVSHLLHSSNNKDAAQPTAGSVPSLDVTTVQAKVSANPPRRTKVRSMPSMPDSISPVLPVQQEQQEQQTDGSSNNVNGNGVQTNNGQKRNDGWSEHYTTKQESFGKLVNQYPPLKVFVEHPDAPPLTGMGELDMRQDHHPMLKPFVGQSCSSDMDVVFLGTASCAPGMTRGVSCTAIRINWRRPQITPSITAGTKQFTNQKQTQPPTTTTNNKSGSSNTNTEQTQAASNTGSTWLFDCGESSQ